jgi:hypothetical protein
MKISKTTINYTLKRYMDITDHVIENFENAVWIWGNDDNEPICIYGVNDDRTLSFVSCFDKGIKEDLPAHIADEKTLRLVIDFISKNI